MQGTVGKTYMNYENLMVMMEKLRAKIMSSTQASPAAPPSLSDPVEYRKNHWERGEGQPWGLSLVTERT